MTKEEKRFTEEDIINAFFNETESFIDDVGLEYASAYVEDYYPYESEKFICILNAKNKVNTNIRNYKDWENYLKRLYKKGVERAIDSFDNEGCRADQYYSNQEVRNECYWGER